MGDWTLILWDRREAKSLLTCQCTARDYDEARPDDRSSSVSVSDVSALLQYKVKTRWTGVVGQERREIQRTQHLIGTSRSIPLFTICYRSHSAQWPEEGWLASGLSVPDRYDDSIQCGRSIRQDFPVLRLDGCER